MTSKKRLMLLTAGLLVVAAGLILLLGGDDADETGGDSPASPARKAAVAPAELPPIAFAGNVGGDYRLFATDERGATPVAVLPEPASDPAWSPDGEQLLFVDEVEGGAPRLGLSAIGPDRVVESITKGPQIPSRISFRGGTGEVAVQATHQTTGEETAGITSRSSIVSVDLETGAHERLFDASGAAYAPAWSPDGKRLVVVVAEAGCDSDGICPQRLELLDPDGSVAKTLTTGGAAGSPDWSPDGERIVFTWDRGRGPGAWELDVAGGTPRRITADGAPVSDPDFSGNGKSVVYSRSCDLFVQPVTGGGATRITDTEDVCEITPDWRSTPGG